MKRAKEIHITDVWNEEKAEGLKEFIQLHAKKQSPDRKLRNEMLGIQYQIEDYIESKEFARKMEVIDFVKMYLKVLNITQKQLAVLFDMQDSNLHKYLTGERKLNASLVLKLSVFSHTDPEKWLRIGVKNELFEIYKEQQKSKEYEKYDYRNLLASTGS